MIGSEQKTIIIPNHFSFKAPGGIYDFNKALSMFDWEFRGRELCLDLTECERANYQAMSLWVLYIWHLRRKNVRPIINFNAQPGRDPRRGAYGMWRKMGAMGWYQVLTSPKENFRGDFYKPLIAIRNPNDFSDALSRTQEYTKNFNVEYEKTLRYIISELLYNTLEHGKNEYIPSLMQYNWYRDKNEISFIIADLGIGIKKHLEQTYTPFDDDLEAIKYAIKPQVSGTFGKIQDPYGLKNNAGIGLYISTNIIRKLNADMHIISGDGALHVSPIDVTGTNLQYKWPGTLINVTIRLGRGDDFSLHTLMSEFRDSARRELLEGEEKEQQNRLMVNMYNYFGRFADVKEEAIRFRDKHLLLAIEDDKSILLDFESVESAPHSFLSALLATPIKKLGMSAYKKIKILNALPEIRETIDFILDENA